MPEWLPIFNIVGIGLFVLAVMLGLTRMLKRLIELRVAGMKIPRLLKRDILLFSAFAIIFGIGSFLRRIVGSTLTTEPIWIVPVTIFALIAIFYWVRVEYTLEREETLPGAPELPANGDAPDA